MCNMINSRLYMNFKNITSYSSKDEKHYKVKYEAKYTLDNLKNKGDEQKLIKFTTLLKDVFLVKSKTITTP